MEELFRCLDIEFILVPAIIGSDLSEKDLAFFRHSYSMTLRPAEYGCMLSHIKAWNMLIDSGDSAALIFEDDIYISHDINKCIEALIILPESPMIVRLEAFNNHITIRRKAFQQMGAYGLNEVLSAQGGTAGYIITRETALFLLARAPEFRNAIDIELFFPGRRTCETLKIYQIVPALCVQYQILQPETEIFFLESGIGGDRADAHVWERRNRRDLTYWIKWGLKPLYHRLQAIALALQGKVRVKVDFPANIALYK